MLNVGVIVGVVVQLIVTMIVCVLIRMTENEEQDTTNEQGFRLDRRTLLIGVLAGTTLGMVVCGVMVIIICSLLGCYSKRV